MVLAAPPAKFEKLYRSRWLSIIVSTTEKSQDSSFDNFSGETPIRVHKNLGDKGLECRCLGNSWRSWNHLLFSLHASYKNFKIDACEVPTTTDLSKWSGDERFWWWNERTVSELSFHHLIWVRANHMIIALMLRCFFLSQIFSLTCSTKYCD
ncbi:unnamed protein product [Eruca vesicaria subsp. sativa]|uniref:Uncharacterized protein n=1 Tax=Eruca vesicaria subsp. sativa TaxID=29727 RepID=A0ABC8IUQ4_ERUVS|nr:unnamed protein product [Eruca vesicaria subsp. sativa]